MSAPRIVVDDDEVLEAIQESKRPLSETSILLNVLSNRGLRVKEEPGENASDAIRKEFNLPSFRRVLNRLKQQGCVEVLTGAQWSERGRDFYDQRSNGKYWAVRESRLEPVRPPVSVPKVMSSSRQQIHLKFCRDIGACRFVGGSGSRTLCKQLDELLDFNDEMLLHDKAREFLDEMQRLSRTHRSGAAGMGGGLYRAADMTDPYVKIDAFTDDPETHIHPGEERPDCPSCVAGKEHYHRKSDGSPVRRPKGPGEDE